MNDHDHDRDGCFACMQALEQELAAMNDPRDPYERARDLIPEEVMEALVERLEQEHTGEGSLTWRRARRRWEDARLEPAPPIRLKRA